MTLRIEEGFPSPLGHKQKIDDSSYVRNFYIFHLRPAPVKQYLELTEEIEFEILNFKKKKKNADGDSRKSKTVDFFLKLIRIILSVILF